ncbi:MAG TPA: hypothetical protein VFV95_17990 [Vicinamibacterales bacterium]|nr:hypothetical protein [Vicinamibacterales bacterium]
MSAAVVLLTIALASSSIGVRLKADTTSFVTSSALAQQGRRTTTAKPAPPPAAAATPRTEPAMLNCPSVLGDGLQTNRTYCDVNIGVDPAAGIIITLPPHTGPVTLTFDLHNRHTYSEEQVKQKKAYSRYTATIGVLTMNNDLLSRAVVLNEFRSEADLVDRITGGSGPRGLKAVAPTGSETVSIVIPEANESVSILGEKLNVVRIDAVDNFTTVGRPIALISNVQITYVPAPPPKPAAPARRK